MKLALFLSALIVTWSSGAGGAELPRGVDDPVRFAAAALDGTSGDRPDSTRAKADLKRDMRRLGAQEGPGLRRWERDKSPTLAMASNMVLPGLGQLYNGRRWKTVIMVGVFSFYIGRTWLEHKKAVRAEIQRDQYPTQSLEWKYYSDLTEFYKETSRDFAWWSGAVWLIGILDAFVDAHLHDIRSVDPHVIESRSSTLYYGVSIRF